MKTEIVKENCDIIVSALTDYEFKFDKIVISNED